MSTTTFKTDKMAARLVMDAMGELLLIETLSTIKNFLAKFVEYVRGKSVLRTVQKICFAASRDTGLVKRLAASPQSKFESILDSPNDK